MYNLHMTGYGQPSGNANSAAGQRVTWPQLAQFDTTDPDAWMRCAESVLRMSKITDPTEKCLYIIGKMDANALREISDLIATLSSVVTIVQYENLKKSILQRFSKPQTVKTQRLLEGEKIGGRTPSQFLRHLRAKAGNAMSADVLRVIWTKGLPSDVQAAIVTKRNTPLDTLAEIADLVAENMKLRSARTSPAVSAVVAANPADERLRRLEDDISSIKSMILLQAPVYNAERNTRSRSRSHARSPSS